MNKPREDFRGREKQQSRYERPQHVFMQRSATSSPLPQLLDVLTSIKEKTIRVSRLFLPPIQINGVMSRRQFVKEHRWCNGSDGADIRPGRKEDNDSSLRNKEPITEGQT